jgi:hypothetical protein
MNKKTTPLLLLNEHITKIFQVNFSSYSPDDSCSYYSESENKSVLCDAGYIYDTEHFKSSTVMEWNIVCEDRKVGC